MLGERLTITRGQRRRLGERGSNKRMKGAEETERKGEKKTGRAPSSFVLEVVLQTTYSGPRPHWPQTALALLITGHARGGVHHRTLMFTLKGDFS